MVQHEHSAKYVVICKSHTHLEMGFEMNYCWKIALNLNKSQQKIISL